VKKRSRSIEDYLEALLMLEESGKVLGITDLAEILKVSKPAATQMASELKEYGYINKKPYGDIQLTESGRKIASQVFHRHKVLCKYLTSIGVSSETAEEDCCRIEHVISEATFRAIEAQINNSK
jgi:DtxR family transcriptional regulator, Mn-dependent transcriptional regulator